MKVAEFGIISSQGSFVINFTEEKKMQETYSLNYQDRLLLEELGPLNTNDLYFKIDSFVPGADKHLLHFGDKLVKIKFPTIHVKVGVPILLFTKTGRELLNLVDTSPDLSYLQLFASKLRKDNDFKFKYASILCVSESGETTHEPFKDIPLTANELEMQKENRIKPEADS